MPNIISINNIIPETFLSITNESDIVIGIDNSELYKFGDYVELLINSVVINFYCDDNNNWNAPIKLSAGIGPLHVKLVKTNLSHVDFFVKINDGDETEKINIFVYNDCVVNSKDTAINTKNNNLKFLSDDNSSFMMLRTNPKLSGNIKLVIDSNNNMYLDTFKINGELSNKKYRKQKISGKSYYSNDVRNVFKDMTSDSIFAIPSLGNNLRNVQRNIDNQFIDIYNYGVRVNDDKLYSENFSMLAPLWINKNLPDFFVIFKCNEFMEIPSEYTPIQRFNFLLQNGIVVKTFDLRKNTIIGNYLYNHQSEIDQYMASTYIDINDYNYNVWNGISIDNGIISKYTETTYDMLHGNIDNQVALDQYITNGYERNRILNPYLINFEFLFDDDLEDTKNLSFNNYFGLYISNNEYKRLYCIKNNSDVNFYDETFNEIKYETYSDEAINLRERIYNVVIDSNSVDHNFIRITDKNKDDYYKVYASLPYKNIASPDVSYIGSINNKFLTININEPLHPGEHLRILDFNAEDGNSIFEVVASKVDNYNNVHDFYDNNSQTIVNYYPYEHSDKFLTHYCDIFSGYSDNDDMFIDHDGNKPSKYDIIKTQIAQIVKSFNNMTNKTFKISSYNDNSISFMAVSSNNMLKFQRITSDIIYNNSNILEITSNIDEYVTYYNNFVFNGSEIKMDQKYADELKAYLPCGFEVWNNRMTYIVDFIAPSTVNVSNDNTHVYSFNKKYYTDIDKRSIAKSDNGIYINIENFPIAYYTLSEDNTGNTQQLIRNNYDELTTSMIVSPYNLDEYILFAYDKLLLNNNILNIYSIAQMQYNIGGILPVRDFNFSVLDSSAYINGFKLLNSNSYYINGYDDLTALTTTLKPGDKFTMSASNKYHVSGVSAPLNIYDMSGSIITSINTSGELPIINGVIINETQNDIDIKDYSINLDDIVKIKGIENNSVESIDNYISLIDDNKNSLKRTSDIPLITPSTCKWCINGTDIIGNKIKLSYANIDISNYDAFNDSSLYLSDNDNFNFFGWGSYKYLSDYDRCYIYNDITDAIYLIENDKIIKRNLKSGITNNKISLLSIFSNNDDIYKKTSTLYYNEYTNSLESIICGKKIILDNLLDDPKKYNNYTFSVMRSSSNHDGKHTEIYIDNNLSFILMILYTSSYNNSYSLREKYLVNNNLDVSSFKFTKGNFDCDMKNIISNNWISCSSATTLNDKVDLFLSAMYKSNENDILHKSNYSFFIEDASFVKANSGFEANKIISSIDNNINVVIDNVLHETNNNINEYLLFDRKTDYKNSDALYIGNDILIYDITNNIKRYTKPANTIKFDGPISYNNALKTYAYYCNPEFINIIDFCVNEDDDIIKATRRDYIGCNTKIKNVNNLPQLWINKVIPNNEYPLLLRKAYLGIDVLYDVDVTRSAINDNLYRVYQLDNDAINNYHAVSGLRNTNLLNTFFGSIGLVMNDYDIFKISNWSSNQYLKIDVKSNDTSDDSIEKYLIKLNISDAANNYFLDINNFVNHYKNDDLAYIYDYIKNMLDRFYVINNKNNISVYKKYCKNITINNKLINYDNSMVKVENIKLDVIEEHGKYYANIELPNDNYQYAIVFKLIK